MATHSSTFAWRIRRTEEPSGLQSMGSQRVRPTEPLTLSQFHGQAVRHGWYPVAPTHGQTSSQTVRWTTPVDDAGGQGFPGGSAGEESACNAGDPGSIPGLGRATGEGIGYPLQYSGLENSMDYSLGGRKESDATFTCWWTVLLPQALLESPSPLLPRLLPCKPFRSLYSPAIPRPLFQGWFCLALAGSL